MSLRFAVVYEAEADFQIATELADRIFVEAIDWLDEEHLEAQRQWISTSTGGERLTWRAIKQLARGAGIRAHGHFEGKPGLPDAIAARRAILFLRRDVPDLDAIILVRDQDDQPERRMGLEQAQRESQGGVLIVVGLAIVERECWVISGFECDDNEAHRLEEVKKELGFDPRHESHNLTACKNDQAPRSAKRVLRHLSLGDLDRERCCWRETGLDLLKQRGGQNGLSEFLNEVRAQLAVLIGHPS